MPDTVIAAIEARAMTEWQPIIEGGCPHFEWHPNIPIQEAEGMQQEEWQQQPPGNEALSMLAKLAEDAALAIMLDPVGNANNDANMSIINFGEQHPNHNEEQRGAPPNEDDRNAPNAGNLS